MFPVLRNWSYWGWAKQSTFMCVKCLLNTRLFRAYCRLCGKSTSRRYSIKYIILYMGSPFLPQRLFKSINQYTQQQNSATSVFWGVLSS